MNISTARPWWRAFSRSSATGSLDYKSVLPVDPWLAAQAKELEQRSLAELAPISVIRLVLVDHGRATDDELVDAVGCITRNLPAYERIFRESDRDFVLLAPGADMPRVRAICANLLAQVGSRSLWRGGRIYLRCGVCTSVEGDPFDFVSASAMAVEALEEAEAYGGVAIVNSSRHHLRVVGADQ